MSDRRGYANSRVDIDPHGDLILDLSSSDTQRSLRVSSKALCLSSLVFRAMLGPSSKFQEGMKLQENAAAGGSAIHINLDDDNYEALSIVMNAIHLRTRKIPTTVTVDLFYQIAIVCDKYDLAEILVPWVKMWTDRFQDVAKKPGYERWFLISWVFRQSRIFNSVTRELILNTKLSKRGLLVTSGGHFVDSGGIPDGIIEAIRSERKSVVSTLLLLPVTELTKYSESALSGLNVCQMVMSGWYVHEDPSRKRNECDTISAGSLFRCLIKAGIMPEQKGVERQTAIRIIKDIQSMGDFGKEIVETVSNKGNPRDTHEGCSPKKRISAAIDDILEGVEGLKLLDFCSEDSILFSDRED